MLLYTDGSVENNGKTNQRANIAVVLEDGTLDGKLIVSKFIGSKTNNEAEYSAVLAALEWAKKKGSAVSIETDSMLVANQVSGKWAANENHLVPYRDKVVELLKETNSTLFWARRSTNKAGLYFQRKLNAKRVNRRSLKK